MSKKILIIDDQEGHREMLKQNIEIDQGFEVLLAASGQAGLESVVQHKPDLVLLDIMMPNMDGLETLKRIKVLAPNTPVAMVTGSWKKEEAKQCLEAGAYEYVTKPIDLNYLKTVLMVKLFG